MLNLIDVEKSLGIELSKKKNNAIFFGVVTVFVIALDALLMIDSSNNYVLNLLISIIFSIAYLIYLVMYIVVIRPLHATKSDFLYKISSSEHTTYNGEIIEFINEQIELNDMEFYVANVRIIGNIKDDIKTLYFPQKVDFKKKNKFVFETFGKVVISLGAKS